MAKRKKLTLEDAVTRPIDEVRADLDDPSLLAGASGEALWLDGDVTLDTEDLDLTALSVSAVVVTGKLVLKKGDVIDHGLEDTWLLVLGDLKARNLILDRASVTVRGAAALKVALFARNQASVTIDGNLDAKAVLLADVVPTFGARLRAPVLDHLRDDNPVADYGSDELKDMCSRDVLIDDLVDHDAVLRRIRTNGKTPFGSAANPDRCIVEKAIKKFVDKGKPVVELDFELDGYASESKRLFSMPPALTALTDLEVLNLKGNRVRVVPDAISQMTSLRELNLASNYIDDISPEIANLPGLERLDVSYPNAPIGDGFEGMKSLKYLRVWGATLSELSASIGRLPALEELELSGAYSKEYPVDFPEWVFGLETLKTLKVTSLALRTVPDGITRLKNLESLTLTGSLMYLERLPDLSSMENLKELMLDGRRVWNYHPDPSPTLASVIPDLRHLERLRMDSWGGLVLADDFFAQMKNLKWLDVAFHGWESLPESLFEVDALEYIDLRYVPIPPEQLARLESTFPGIEILR